MLNLPPLHGQTTVDKTVASVSDGVRKELITLSDLKWELALMPEAPVDPPSKEHLNRALRIVIDQRIFALEAERIPRPAPNDKEVADYIDQVLKRFASTAEFERRLNAVGFSSVKDENFERLISKRLNIEKYLDFRFRSFVVVTAEDEAKYYREIWLPDFKAKYPGLLWPTLDSKRADINKQITEDRIASQMETFLDEAKRRAEVVTLIEP